MVAACGSVREDPDVQYRDLLAQGRDYLDRTSYLAVHFHGPKLSDSLTKSANFLAQLEECMSREPHALCMSAQYSWEDEATDLAWRVTVVLGKPVLEDETPAGFPS